MNLRTVTQHQRVVAGGMAALRRDHPGAGRRPSAPTRPGAPRGPIKRLTSWRTSSSSSKTTSSTRRLRPHAEDSPRVVDDDLLDGRVVHQAAAGARGAAGRRRGGAPSPRVVHQRGVGHRAVRWKAATAPGSGPGCGPHPPDRGAAGAARPAGVTSWRTSGRSTRSAARSVGDHRERGRGRAGARREAGLVRGLPWDSVQTPAPARGPPGGAAGRAAVAPRAGSGHPATSPPSGPPAPAPATTAPGWRAPAARAAAAAAAVMAPAAVAPPSVGRRGRRQWGRPTSGPQALARPAGPRSEPGGDGARARGEAPLPRRPPGAVAVPMVPARAPKRPPRPQPLPEGERSARNGRARPGRPGPGRPGCGRRAPAGAGRQSPAPSPRGRTERRHRRKIEGPLDLGAGVVVAPVVPVEDEGDGRPAVRATQRSLLAQGPQGRLRPPRPHQVGGDHEQHLVGPLRSAPEPGIGVRGPVADIQHHVAEALAQLSQEAHSEVAPRPHISGFGTPARMAPCVLRRWRGCSSW